MESESEHLEELNPSVIEREDISSLFDLTIKQVLGGQENDVRQLKNTKVNVVNQ